jgi:hypothetical protein
VANAAGAGKSSATVLSITSVASSDLQSLQGIRSQQVANPVLARRLDDVIDQLTKTLQSLTEEDLRTQFAKYQPMRQQLLHDYPNELVALSAAGRATAAGTVPQVFTSLNNIVFTAGVDVSVSRNARDANARGSGTTSSFSIATNLLGATAGSGFDAIGAEGMKTYLTQNIAAGTAIPMDKSNSLTAFLGLGLGQYAIGSVTLWPVINVEQTDTADTRTPVSLRSVKTDQKTWSAPTIGIGIVLPEGWYKKASLGKAGLIPTIGVRVPHYYPGDPFAAIAALFSTKRSEYVRAGSAVYTFGLALPLTKAAAAQQSP